MGANYYAIIPAPVRYAKIPDLAKLLYGEITSLSNEKGFCWATNRYFAKLYDVHPSTIKRLIQKLVDAQFVSIEFEPNSRRLYGCISIHPPRVKNEPPPGSKTNPPPGQKNQLEPPTLYKNITLNTDDDEDARRRHAENVYQLQYSTQLTPFQFQRLLNRALKFTVSNWDSFIQTSIRNAIQNQKNKVAVAFRKKTRIIPVCPSCQQERPDATDCPTCHTQPVLQEIA